MTFTANFVRVVNNYVKVGKKIHTFDDLDPDECQTAIDFVRYTGHPDARIKGAAWKPWPGMPGFIAVVGG